MLGFFKLSYAKDDFYSGFDCCLDLSGLSSPIGSEVPNVLSLRNDGIFPRTWLLPSIDLVCQPYPHGELDTLGIDAAHPIC